MSQSEPIRIQVLVYRYNGCKRVVSATMIEAPPNVLGVYGNGGEPVTGDDIADMFLQLCGSSWSYTVETITEYRDLYDVIPSELDECYGSKNFGEPDTFYVG